MRRHTAGLAPVHARRAPRANAQRGFLMVTAVVLIVVVALLLTVMIYFSVLGGQATVRHLGSKQALFIAGTGLERGVHALLAQDPLQRLSCDAVTGNAGTTDVAFGDGRFTVTGGASSYSSVPTTLRLAIGTGDVTIPVTGLAGYAASGRVLIGREAVNYSKAEATDDAVCGGPGRAPCLAGAQRGQDGTPAMAHAAGTPLGQYQCDLQSRGGVPDLASARGRRIVQQAVQQQEGWAIGVNGTILRWAGGPAGNPAWTTAASPVTVELMDLSLLSYAEGWAVGRAGGGAAQRPLILYWNGATWSARNSNLNINQDLFGVHCADGNDCWAVGTAGGNAAERPLILYWNGAAWSARNSNLNINETLDSVHCVHANDCWAVGTAGGSAAQRPLILHWDGNAWSTHNSNLNINQNLMAVGVVGARQHPQAAWREVYQ